MLVSLRAWSYNECKFVGLWSTKCGYLDKRVTRIGGLGETSLIFLCIWRDKLYISQAKCKTKANLSIKGWDAVAI